MSKKITLTSCGNKPVDFRIDEIEEIIVKNEVTFIIISGRFIFPVKESKSRVLKMIETAK